MAGGTEDSLVRSIHTLFESGATGALTDAQLLDRFLDRRGESAEAAFEALVTRHGPMVFDICRGVLRTSHDIEDAFQATFLILACKAASIRQRDSLASWLFGVARRVASRARSQAARRVVVERTVAEMASHSPTSPGDPRDFSLLIEEVENLPAKYRESLILCYLQGFTYEAAAHHLNCPLGTLSVRLKRARERLRDRLTRRGIADPSALFATALTPPAEVQATLIAMAVRAAVSSTSSKAGLAGAVSATVLTLRRGAGKTLFLDKLKVILGTLLTLAVGGGLVAWSAAVGSEGNERGTSNTTASSQGHQFSAPLISLDHAGDVSRVLGPGTLTLMTEEGLLTGKRINRTNGHEGVALKPREVAVSAKKKVPLTITWTQGMRYFRQKQAEQARTEAILEFVSTEDDAEGHVIPTVGNELVLAGMEGARIGCRMMRVHLDRPISFTRVEHPPKMAEIVPAEPERPPEITLIECFNDVTVVSRRVDPEHKVLVQQQRIEAKDLLTYDRLTGDFHISGPGTVYLFNREGGGGGGGKPNAGARPAANPALPNGRGNAPNAKAQKKINPALVPLKLTQVKFSEQMKGRFGTGTDEDNTEPRWAEFFGNIESLHGPVPDVKTALGVSPDLNFRLNANKLRADDSFMTAQMMRVISEPPPTGSPEGTPAGNFLYAWKNVNVRFDTASIEADKATYDSTKDLYHAYGDDDRQIFLSQRNGPGQPNSQSCGAAVRYNHRTGEAQIDNPLAFHFVDKTGSRPKPPNKPKPAPPKKFRKLNPPSRNSVERKGIPGEK